jgi:hypothetical protein
MSPKMRFAKKRQKSGVAKLHTSWMGRPERTRRLAPHSRRPQVYKPDPSADLG